MTNHFFEEWAEDKKGKKNTFFVLLFMFLIGTTLTGVFNNFPGEQGNAQVFITLSIVVGITMIVETMFEKKNFYRTLGLGTKPVIALAVGIVAGLFLQMQGQILIPTPFATIISADVILSFFYIVIAAVLIEELFFRGVFQPVAAGLLSDYLHLEKNVSGVIALVVQASMFSWFHWRVLGGSQELLAITFVFAVVVTIGNYFFKSLGFGIGIHFTNNLLAWTRMVV